MNLSLSAFPVVANLSVLDESISDEMKDSISRDSISTLYQILGNLLNDAYKGVNGILSYYNEKGELSRKYNSVVSELSKRLLKNNIFKTCIVE